MLTNIERSKSSAGYAGDDSSDDSGRIEMSAELSVRLARLIRRAPPVVCHFQFCSLISLMLQKPDSKPILTSTPRRFNLVRRVTKGPSEKVERHCLDRHLWSHTSTVSESAGAREGARESTSRGLPYRPEDPSPHEGYCATPT